MSKSVSPFLYLEIAFLQDTPERFFSPTLKKMFRSTLDKALGFLVGHLYVGSR